MRFGLWSDKNGKQINSVPHLAVKVTMLHYLSGLLKNSLLNY